ncbi:MAG: vWA domain-containing protein [Brevinemataceae bacterium]
MLFVNLAQAPLIILLFSVLLGVIIFGVFRRKFILNSFFSSYQKKMIFDRLNPHIYKIKIGCVIAATVLIGLSLLDPRGKSISTDVKLEGIDIVMTFDVSRSMDVQDIAPSRLEAAKKLSLQLSDLLVGSRVGLVAFAADAFRMLPLTTDIESLNLFVNELSTDLITSQSTDLQKALEQSVASFSTNALTYKMIILFTDGENLDGNVKQALDNIEQSDIHLVIVGVGTEEGGKIPVTDARGQHVGYLKNILRQDVVSKLDTKYLEKLAADSKGDYLSIDSEVFGKIDKLIKNAEKNPFDSKSHSLLEPRFRGFIIVALLMILLYLFLPERRVLKKLMILFFVFAACPSYGLGEESKAYGLYKKGEYSKALRFYQRSIANNPKNVKSKFGEATALYQLDRGERAEKSFLALTNSENQELAAKSLFNAANAYVKGKKLDEALELYKKIMREHTVKSKLYNKALNNYLYVQALKNQQGSNSPENDENQDQNTGQNKDQQNQQSQGQDNQQNPQEESSEDKQSNASNSEQNKKDQTPSQSVSPSDIDNLLGVAEEEEKNNFQRQDKKTDKSTIIPQNKW